jgi:hypothetical protein
VVAAQRDSRISHCVLLACSGDICDAATRLHRLNRALALVVGRFAPGDSEDLKTAARKAASGESSSQREFELVDTLNPDRLSCLRNLLILGDKRDPVAPEAVCLRFAHRVRNERYGWSTMRDVIIRLEKTLSSAMRCPSCAISRSLQS